jgi:hypothetical protein
VVVAALLVAVVPRLVFVPDGVRVGLRRVPVCVTLGVLLVTLCVALVPICIALVIALGIVIVAHRIVLAGLTLPWCCLLTWLCRGMIRWRGARRWRVIRWRGTRRWRVIRRRGMIRRGTILTLDGADGYTIKNDSHRHQQLFHISLLPVIFAHFCPISLLTNHR